MLSWAIYGGAGFIGQHLAHAVLSRRPGDRVRLLDIRSLEQAGRKAPLEDYLDSDRLAVLNADVRKFSDLKDAAGSYDVIVNLAAVHREPGHRAEEYFETNVSGAENVCRIAEETGCGEILFTSSISVYGIHDRPVDEQTPVEPRTPYGQSKFKAERIHREWARNTGGRLSIIRPGVVFGQGEQGNVTRLVNEMLKRQRVIRVVPDQPKAGIYIEELLEVMFWLREQPVNEERFQLVNGVSHENLTFNSHGEVLGKMQNFKRRPLSVPGSVLGLATGMMRPMSGLFPAASKLHPQRLAKLLVANDIRPGSLSAMGYPFAWPLERAMADWLAKGL